MDFYGPYMVRFMVRKFGQPGYVIRGVMIYAIIVKFCSELFLILA